MENKKTGIDKLIEDLEKAEDLALAVTDLVTSRKDYWIQKESLIEFLKENKEKYNKK